MTHGRYNNFPELGLFCANDTLAMEDKAAICFIPRKLNGKLIAALLFIPYFTCLVFDEETAYTFNRKQIWLRA